MRAQTLTDTGVRPTGSTHAGTLAPAHLGQAGPVSTPPASRSLRLRVRVGLFFTVAALVVTLLLSAVTYYSARAYLLDQRDESARSQAFANGRTVRDALAVEGTDPDRLVKSIRTEGGGFALLQLSNGRFFGQSLQFPPTAMPSALLEHTSAGESGMQRFTASGDPFVGVGVYIASLDATYFEAFSLASVERTLRIIATTLVVAAIATTLFAAGLGYWVSGRLLRPIKHVADAAGNIASGGLDTRLGPESDPDLARLAKSFNDMADAVQARIEREARFSSDVSHELRSPITALTAAVEVLDARRADLPERTQQALDVVVSQVHRFDNLVLDLLELSRLDVGAADVHRDELRLSEVVPRIAVRHGFADVPVESGPKPDVTISIDKLRLERVVANLLENARIHAGGATRISIEPEDNHVLLAVEDAGPGVGASEKGRIFERFARGTASRHRVGGTGLGLALVVEHARANGGDAWVEDRPGGGARFVVRFPASVGGR